MVISVAGFSSRMRWAAASPEMPPPMMSTWAVMANVEQDYRIYMIYKINPVNPVNLVILSLTEATIWLANIRRHFVLYPLQHQLPDHLHERRMRARCRRPHHLQPNLLRDSARLDIQIVNHFHMIRNKP